METMITTETKARIYGLYIGQMIEYSNEAGAFIIPLSAGNLSVAAVEHPKLRLKPLSAITDEDLFILAKIEFADELSCIIERLPPKQNRANIIVKSGHSENKISIYRNFCEFSDADFSDREGYDGTTSSLSIKSFQYLQSKGYALPYQEYSIEDLVKDRIYKLEE